MNKAIFAGAVMAAAVAASPAIAAPSYYYSSGYTYPYATTAQVFESFENAPNGAYVANTGQVGVTGETVSGNVQVQTGTVPNVAADPTPGVVGGTKFLSIVSGSYSVALNSSQFFSFIFGSLDTYNTLSLTFASGPAVTFTGTQLADLIAAAGGPTTTFNSFGNSSTGGRFTIATNGGPALTSATFSSSQSAFEIDDLASAVPEPATWGMMILGFGLMGAQLRTRRRKVTFATA